MQYIYIFIYIWVIWAIYMVYIWNLTVLEQQDQVWMSSYFLWKLKNLGVDHILPTTGNLHNQDFRGCSAFLSVFLYVFNLKTDFQILGSFCLRIKIPGIFAIFFANEKGIFSSRHGGPCCWDHLGSAVRRDVGRCISNENVPAKMADLIIHF